MRRSASSQARSWRGSSDGGSPSSAGSCCASRGNWARSTTPSMRRSRSSASSSRSSPRRPPGPSSSRVRGRSQRGARRSAQPPPPTPSPARSAATSPRRCRTTSSTAPTRQSRRSARSRCGSVTTNSSDYPEYVPRNVEIWTKANAEHTGANARQAWAKDEIDWGVFAIPESELDVLGDVAGLDVVELGCGTAYFSAWLAKRGARPVGVDPTPAQLATARALQRDFGLDFPLLEGVGESVPLPDASFDLALSEYGASIWADPYRWIPEAARLLRPGGRLVFLRNSTLVTLCQSLEGATEQLQRPQQGLCRIEWPDTGEVEFHLPAGELIDLLHGSGFQLERLL